MRLLSDILALIIICFVVFACFYVLFHAIVLAIGLMVQYPSIWVSVKSVVFVLVLMWLCEGLIGIRL